eukprot:3342017-Rhodomonas_salina.2
MHSAHRAGRAGGRRGAEGKRGRADQCRLKGRCFRRRAARCAAVRRCGRCGTGQHHRHVNGVSSRQKQRTRQTTGRGMDATP